MGNLNLIKKIIKQLTPLFILELIRPKYLPWQGDYSSWQEATSNSTGYDQDSIISKVSIATAKVRDGLAVYERDSVLFDQIVYSWPLLASLMWIATQKNKLHVLDFGGALGSTYYQNRKFLNGIEELSWNIVEQEMFVNIGRNSFEDERMKFYLSIKSCLEQQKNIDVILLSGVLQYIEEPYVLIEEIINTNIQFVIIDRLSLIERDKDHVSVQKVPSSIYDASYPSRFFNRQNILNALNKSFQLIEEFDAYVPNITMVDGKYRSSDKGFLLKRY